MNLRRPHPRRPRRLLLRSRTVTGAEFGGASDMAIVSLAVAIVGHAIMGMFSTPKESVKKLEEWVKDENDKVYTRLGTVEERHGELEREFIRASVRLDTSLKAHTETVYGLTTAVKELDRKVARL